MHVVFMHAVKRIYVFVLQPRSHPQPRTHSRSPFVHGAATADLTAVIVEDQDCARHLDKLDDSCGTGKAAGHLYTKSLGASNSYSRVSSFEASSAAEASVEASCASRRKAAAFATVWASAASLLPPRGVR